MAFDLSDWAPASDYTNDAAANVASAAAEAAQCTANGISSAIDSTISPAIEANADAISNVSDVIAQEITVRKSFMRFGEEDSNPTLTLGKTDSPAQMQLTNERLQFLYQDAVVSYVSGTTEHINNVEIIQQLLMGGFAFVPRANGNLAIKWVGGA